MWKEGSDFPGMVQHGMDHMWASAENCLRAERPGFPVVVVEYDHHVFPSFVVDIAVGGQSRKGRPIRNPRKGEFPGRSR